MGLGVDDICEQIVRVSCQESVESAIRRRR